jgi:DNA-binding transcriptional LysR family regulator
MRSLKDSSLVARKMLIYRHQLVASPDYLRSHEAPETPQDLLRHRLLAFSYGRPEASWTFVHVNGKDQETLTFQPHLSVNDFAGLTPAFLTGGGIGDLPLVVQPELVRDGGLVEVMPRWRFCTLDLSLVHLGNRHMPKAVRVFKEFAVQMAPTLFQHLPRRRCRRLYCSVDFRSGSNATETRRLHYGRLSLGGITDIRPGAENGANDPFHLIRFVER